MTEQSTEPAPPVAAGIVVRDGRVLMVRRSLPEGDLLWQFPAGKVEPSETAEQAATRETAEETGLTVEAVSVLGERIHPTTGRTITYVACNPLSGETHATATREIAEIAWVPLSQLHDLLPNGLQGLHRPVREYLVEQTMAAYKQAFDTALRGDPQRAARLAELEDAAGRADTEADVRAAVGQIHYLLREVAAELAADWPQMRFSGQHDTE